VKSRLAVVLVGVALWMGAIAWRLYDLQVARHEDYVHRAERQQQKIVELDAPRGTIYDRNGVELAVSVEVQSAFAVPREITDPGATASAIARLVPDVDGPKLLRALKSDREFVWAARKLDPPQAKALKDLALPGIYFLPESKRYYPLRALASQVLGYMGTDGHGLAGLEAAYDKEIAGRAGRRRVLRDAKRGTLLRDDGAFADAEPGQDLHLTLDASIQYVVERELAKAVEQFHAKSASAVFMDPRSGEVLAMASLPSFDPNRFHEASPADWRNRVIQDAFEPGSTFKMVTVTAALEANLIDPSDVFDCQMGSITLANVTIRDHKAFGVLTVADILAKSSNIGAIKIGLTAGAERLYAKTRAFGFGQETGIDLPGESAGLLRPLERWTYLTKAYISFGQEMGASALQVANAFGAVANGGDLLRPYVVRAIGRDGNLRELHPRPEVLGHPTNEATLRSLERMLEGVVSGGTGKAAVVDGYIVAGKTGTAQKAGVGGYSADRFVGSFVGFVPARHPVLAGIVVVDEPHGGLYHGGDVAAPAFGAVAREALLYLGVPPERDVPQRWPGEPASQDAAAPGQVVAAAYRSTDPAAAPVSVPIAAGGGDASSTAANAGPVLPDLTGLSARAAIATLSRLGLRPVLNGRGVVARQEPGAGGALPQRGGRVELWLLAGPS
jgi:cell division protein FtsI (penicillin-binding protein 3)